MPAVKEFLKRTPLVAVLGLSTMVVLRAAGKVNAADTVEFFLKMAGALVSDPELIAAVTAGAGGVFKSIQIMRRAIQ